MINISASIIITILKYLSKLYKTFLSFARSEVDVCRLLRIESEAEEKNMLAIRVSIYTDKNKR